MVCVDAARADIAYQTERLAEPRESLIYEAVTGKRAV